MKKYRVDAKRKELEDRLKLMLKEDVITKYQCVSQIICVGLIYWLFDIGNETKINKSEYALDRRSSWIRWLKNAWTRILSWHS